MQRDAGAGGVERVEALGEQRADHARQDVARASRGQRRASPWRHRHETVGSRHKRRYERDELHQKLTAAGYSVEYLTPYMAVLHPVLWWGRRITGRGHHHIDDSREAWNLAGADLRVRPVSGAVLGLALRQEIRFVRRRIELPVGASLLAIARAA